MSKLPCPNCGVPTMRAGAVKCPACRAWVGPKLERPRGGLSFALRVAALVSLGMALGGAMVASALALRVCGPPWAWTRAAALGASAATPDAGASARAPSAAASAALGASAAPSAPQSEARATALVTFAEPRLVRVAVAPVDAVVADDDATLLVLGDDGSVRVHEIDSGNELARVVLPGKGTELRLLAGRYLVVLGVPGVSVPVIDLSTRVVSRFDLGGVAAEVVALSSAPSLVAASAAARKVARFSLDGLRLEGQLLLSRPASGLILTRGLDASAREGAAPGRELLAVLTAGKRADGPGTVELIDPVAAPFGASRCSLRAAVDPRRGVAGSASLFVLDRSAGQLLEVSRDRSVRIANVGEDPLSAHRLMGGWLVTIDGAGTATVLAEATLALEATLSLGGSPSDAAATPDGRALLVALGRSAGGQGATTAIIAGDPPIVAATLTTGAGARTVRIGKSGRFAAVTAFAGKSVALLERR